jgi:hypothetical protein
MAYATWITVKCPCERTLGCHKREFFLSVGGASMLVAYENGFLSPLRNVGYGA